ncbi:MAG TPA: 2-C-methyl-D-erythritol 4-phosphate cytidylyltransferase [Rhodopirellula sp.]|nr:2-C-methyl-D-erythritol 4-phosphate cytidylyltransferase [Rhodopirellula sp.]
MPPPDQNTLASGSIAAILPAAGSGRRFGAASNKLFAELAGKPLWFHAASRLADSQSVGRVVLVISQADEAVFRKRYAAMVEQLGVELVLGGSERTDSVQAGLDHLADDPMVQWVAIHDAARPLVRSKDITAVFAVAQRTGAAVLATPVPGTVKRGKLKSGGSRTVDRRELWLALTPQVFSIGLLKQAYQKHNGRPATDDAQLVERIGRDVTLVQGSADNLKITYPEDLSVAEAILATQSHQSE